MQELLSGKSISSHKLITEWIHLYVLKPTDTKFNVHESVHHNNILVIIPTGCTSQSLFNLTTALHVLGITITHLQEHKTTATIASGNHYTILLSAAIVEEFQLFHNSSRQQYGVMVTRCCGCSCFVLMKMGDSDAQNM